VPDENKFQKLREIGYRIPVTCSMCTHGYFTRGKDFGSCTRHRYHHLKHDNPEEGRPVSVHRSGTCEDPTLIRTSFLVAGMFGAHLEFLEGKGES